VSLITDVVIVAMYAEDDAITAVNAALGEYGEDQQLRPLDMSAAGGHKAISARVYAASFNYLNCPDMREALLSAPWKYPREVTFCVSGETWEERFYPEVSP
jgi:hypothetical protein